MLAKDYGNQGYGQGNGKRFFPHFSGQRESNSEFTVGRLFVSILKKWENHRHIASPSLQTLGYSPFITHFQNFPKNSDPHPGCGYDN